MIRGLGSDPSAAAQSEPLPKTGRTGTDLRECCIKVQPPQRKRKKRIKVVRVHSPDYSGSIDSDDQKKYLFLQQALYHFLKKT